MGEFGTGWGQGKFAQLYEGCLDCDSDRRRYAFYRFHVPDPVYFERDIRVTIQQIGGVMAEQLNLLLESGLELYKAGGTEKCHPLTSKTQGVIFERWDDDWSSVAYFYLDRPENNL